MKRPKIYRAKKASGRTFNNRAAQIRLYSALWEEFRLDFLSFNQHCYVCGRKSDVVDHITPHLGKLELFWKEDNYLALCAQCHNTITAKFDRYHKPGKSIEKKLTWISLERARRGVTSRVKVVDLPPDAYKMLIPSLP